MQEEHKIDTGDNSDELMTDKLMTDELMTDELPRASARG